MVKEHQYSFYKESGQLGPSVEICVPGEHERACDPLGLYDIAVYDVVLKLGVPVPFPDIIVEKLNFYGIAPC